MNKKFILTCGLLVVLALMATGCKLPASGSPPIPSSAPVEPTATTGEVVSAEPTSTSVPPTAVVVTEAVPPTAVVASPVPPTAIPPTPVPPTPAPLPPAVRIQFATGGTSAVINGNLDAGQTIYYVLKASATQTMSVKVTSPNTDVTLGIFGADNQVLLGSDVKDTIWSGTLPTSEDYYLNLTAGGSATSYTLTVDIPPLPTSPTANVTQVPGTFDPVATYGNPTFDDPMTGGNINDWTNPVTGLLPNTNYIKIVESDAKFYVTGKMAGFSTWYFTWHELTDFYLQSTFNSGSCTGKDAYGLIVRGPEHLAGVSYGYVVSFSCDGQYYVFRLDGANPYTTKDLVSWSKSDYILAGANQENVLGIKAVGNTLTIYANGHQIAEIVDSMYEFGRYGVFVSSELTANYTYRVVHMSYWDLKP
jgi:hypothetical protein